MVSSAATSGVPSRMLMAYARTVAAPRKLPTFTALPWASMESSHVAKPWGPRKRAQRARYAESAPSPPVKSESNRALVGAGVVASPRISEVTPCEILPTTRPSANRSWCHECDWMSMNPGATTMPVASTRSFAAASASPPFGVDGDDPVAPHADVALVPRVAGAVDDATVDDDEIVGELRRRWRVAARCHPRHSERSEESGRLRHVAHRVPTHPLGNRVVLPLIVPHHPRDPPSRPVPVQLEVVHPPPDHGSLLGLPHGIHAPHLRHVAEPLHLRPDLVLDEPVLHEALVGAAAELLGRHAGDAHLALPILVERVEHGPGRVERAVAPPLARRAGRTADDLVRHAHDVLDRADVGRIGGRVLRVQRGGERDADRGQGDGSARMHGKASRWRR